VFFVLSFLAPTGGGEFHLFGGAVAFIQTPVWACQVVMESPDTAPSHSVFLFSVMMTAWIANLTVFTRLPFVVAVIAILLPWPAYIFIFSFLAGFIPFYPWAIGIALIHIGRLAGPGPKIEQRTIWTDFDSEANHRTATNPAMTILFQYKIKNAGSLSRSR
jgi:hypothetical protein